MAEEWKAVVGYEGLYEVSSAGRVRSLDRLDSIGRPRKGHERKLSVWGRSITVSLDNGWSKTFAVHRLVLEAFVGPCPEEWEAHHKNGDLRDNRLENLQWGPLTEANRGSNRGTDNGMAKYTEADFEEMERRYMEGTHVAEIAEAFETSADMVYRVLRGEARVDQRKAN